MFCCTLLYVNSSIAIILMGKKELIALLNLSSWCLVMVERLFLAVPRGCLQFVIVVFPDHTHLLILIYFKIFYFFCGSFMFFLPCVCYTSVCILFILPCVTLGKGLTSWLTCTEYNCELSLSLGILGQVWYLIVSIPDLCTFTYLICQVLQPCVSSSLLAAYQCLQQL